MSASITTWKEFADKNGGRFIQNSKQIMTIEFELDHGKVIFETLTKPFSSSNKINTLVSYNLNFNPEIDFKVRHQGIFNKLFMAFGMQDISIEDTYFDDNFVIQGTHPEKIRDLFKDETIVNFLPKSYELTFELDNQKLVYSCRGFIQDLSMLDCLLTLMKNTSNRLKTI